MLPGARIGEGDQAEIFALDASRVLKLFRPAVTRDAAVEEARKTDLVWGAGYPCPRIYEVVEHDGRHGIVMERLDGPTLLQRAIENPHDVGLLEAFADLQLRLAALACDPLALPALEARIEARCSAFALPDHERERIRSAVAACPRGASIYHGDFHPQNVLSTPRGPFVIDWFAACHAHAAADVAQSCLIMATTEVPASLPQSVRDQLHASRERAVAVYSERYFAGSTVTRSQVRQWLRPLALVRLHQLRRSASVLFDQAKLDAIADGDLTLV